jgi:hypothetical protein
MSVDGEWNNEIVNILNKIRLNSITLSSKHRNLAIKFMGMSRYFDVPVIVMSTVSSSLGSIQYMSDTDKASLNLFISMVITILTGIKLYMNLTQNINQEILLSREFYILSCDIFKNLNLNVKDRPNATSFLNDAYNNYIKLCEQSNLYNKMKYDELLKIDDDNYSSSSTISSSGSSSDLQNIIINIDRDEF